MSQNTIPLLSSIEVETSPDVKASVIWLHGLGADGNDFVPLVPELHIPASLGIRFIFPHAPVMPVTINNGYEMRAWYDILSLSTEAPPDHSGIAKSNLAVRRLIEKEITRGIPAHRIILAGFSQGAVIALNTALTYPSPLAGILALSGYLIQEGLDRTPKIPIFLAHGSADKIVPFILGEMACQSLLKAGFPVTWKSYAMEHQVCTKEINDIREWLLNVLSHPS